MPLAAHLHSDACGILGWHGGSSLIDVKLSGHLGIPYCLIVTKLSGLVMLLQMKYDIKCSEGLQLLERGVGTSFAETVLLPELSKFGGNSIAAAELGGRLCG